MKRNWRSHYILVLANIFLILAIGINFAVADLVINDLSNTQVNGNFYFILISPLLSILVTGILYFFDIKFFLKDYPYKKFHFNKKWTKFYISGISIYCLNLLIIFSLTFVASIVANQMWINPDSVLSTNEIIQNIKKIITTILWVVLGISCVISLLSFALIKYAYFKIDIELLQRQKGSSIDSDKVDDNPIIIDLSPTKNENLKNKTDQKPDDSLTATAGLSSN